MKLTAQGTAFLSRVVLLSCPSHSMPSSTEPSRAESSVDADSIPQLQHSRSVWQARCLVLVAIFVSALSLTLVRAFQKQKTSRAWKEAQRDAVASASFLPPRPAMNVSALPTTTTQIAIAKSIPKPDSQTSRGPSFEALNGGINPNPFLEHLRTLWAQRKYPPITDADGGSYQGCHRDGPLVWVYFWGHLRTFGMHTQNLASFLDGAQMPCMFLVIYTRDEFDHPARHLDKYIERMHSEGRSVVSEMQKTARKLGANRSLAFAVTHGGQIYPQRKLTNPIWDYFRGLAKLGTEVANLHGIPQDDRDLIVMTRPDIVFSHAVNLHRVRTIMAKQKVVLLPHHDHRVGGNDPSEMLTIGPRQFFEESCLAAPSDGAPCGFEGFHWLIPNPTRLSWRCGYFASWMLYWAYSRGIMPFFYFGPLKLHLHRLDGSFNVGVMRPISHSVKTPNSKVLGVVDLTRRAKCVVGGGPEACNSELHSFVSKSPRSKCWGSTEYVRVNPGFEKNFSKKEKNKFRSGFWLCKDFRDIDQTDAGCIFDVGDADGQ